MRYHAVEGALRPARPEGMRLGAYALRRTTLPKLFGNSQARANRLTISRIIAAYTNASALAHSLS
jgi:hypothetical protein